MKGPDSKTVNKHDPVQFICEIVASSLEHFTHAVWWKDGSPTKLPANANATFQATASDDSLFICSLVIPEVSKSDEGVYSCYAYYDQTILRKMKIDHAVESNRMSADLKVKGEL